MRNMNSSLITFSGKSMNHLSNNEINNIIYLIFKYTFNIKNPDNKDISNILLEIVDNQSVENIIEHTFNYVNNIYPHLVDIINKQKEHALFVVSEFLKLSDDIRNNLGDDKDAEEFIVKH